MDINIPITQSFAFEKDFFDRDEKLKGNLKEIDKEISSLIQKRKLQSV